MNYFDYINNLKPNNHLKNDTRAKVKLEISKQKIKKNNIKKAYISMAACFIVIAVSIIASKALTKNPNYIDTPPNTLETEQNPSEKILVSIASDKTKTPQRIQIEDRLYLQYFSEDSEKKTDNAKIEINKSDIGELLYTLDNSNLVSNQIKSSSNSDAEPNQLYNAEVYSLNSCQNNTVILVKEKDKEEYYLFYLADTQ